MDSEGLFKQGNGILFITVGKTWIMGGPYPLGQFL